MPHLQHNTAVRPTLVGSGTDTNPTRRRGAIHRGSESSCDIGPERPSLARKTMTSGRRYEVFDEPTYRRYDVGWQQLAKTGDRP